MRVPGGILGPHVGHLGVIWARLGAIWGLSECHLGVLWGLLGASWEPSSRSLTLIDATAPGHAMKVDKHTAFRGIAEVDHPDVSGGVMLQAFCVTE